VKKHTLELWKLGQVQHYQF